MFLLQLFEFHKKNVPDDDQEKKVMAKNLLKFKVSLQQYTNALMLDNVTM